MLLTVGYHNDPSTELMNAAMEQQKITELRLARVAGAAADAPSPAAAAADRRAGQILVHLGAADHATLRSPITTHVLDTCLGRPASDVGISLERLSPGSGTAWEALAMKRTNKDGRVPDLLPPADTVLPGTYRITFDTEEYMARCKAAHPTFFPEKPFYPSASVVFQITPEQTRQHFHVPLTWNPYGYSTYRGS